MIDMAERRYVLVFYDLAREFPAIYRDDAALATWLRLLMIADGVWPAPAHLPRTVAQEPLDKLVTAGLVEVNDDDEFTVKGLAKGRQARSEQARRAAEARWNKHESSTAVSNAVSTADRNASQRNATHSNATQENTNEEPQYDERFTALASLMEDLTGRAYALANPFSKMAQNALELIDRHGWQAFEQRARLVAQRIGANPGVDEILFSVANSMRRGADTADVQKDERKVEIEDDMKRRLERTQLSLHYQHTDPAEHPACPACRGEVAL